MKTIAIVSSVGGAGRTTLTAALAGLLAAREHVALAAECDPRNVLALHFGLRESAREGLVTHLAGGPGADDAWSRAALQSDDGVLVLPWGSLADGHASGDPRDDDASALLDARPGWLRELLARVDLPAHTIALVDAGTWPSAHARQAIDAADLVLGVLTPCATACATLPRLIAALVRAQKRSVFVANAVVPARQLHMDVVALLRARLGAAMLPYLVHADTGVPAALAAGENFCLSAPSSQAAHDLHGIASWLSHWSSGASLDAPDELLAQHVARGSMP
ncbi:cellulose synthase operon protein YhjQ [Paraburkholderia guartelaensis]|uniref:Cellulose synthase operon protein YhjQ n=1 Tax=Paraburkholderia guartelaensis TaxID=2546446 RepID=A0A4R5L8X1_9BURK|nr:cellulose biosynthesis protein BcsQ [Paraburkholderia guartelaensis]TDG04408.1 cellulose synthase operon protein YhjQ [Paraburkholderia guartelaensis]